MPKDKRRHPKKSRITSTLVEKQSQKKKGLDAALVKRLVKGILVLVGGLWTLIQIYNYFYPRNQNKESALIQLAIPPDDKYNPRLYLFKDKGVYYITTTITNLGNVAAFDLRENTKVVSIIDDSLFSVIIPDKPLPLAFNKKSIIAPGYIFTIASNFRYSYTNANLPTYKGQRTFFCIKINYSDNSSDNKNYTGIFETTGFLENSSLRMVNSDIYERVDSFLLNNKVW